MTVFGCRTRCRNVCGVRRLGELRILTNRLCDIREASLDLLGVLGGVTSAGVLRFERVGVLGG